MITVVMFKCYFCDSGDNSGTKNNGNTNVNNHQSDNTDDDIGSGNHHVHDDDTRRSSICTFLIEIQKTVIVKIGNMNRPKQT